MFASLRFRLPALFLVGILLAGLVAALISIRFFQSYTRARAVDELRSESVGIVQLYARQAGVEGVPYNGLVAALGGDEVYWAPAFRGATLLQGIPNVPKRALSREEVRRIKKPVTLEMTIHGRRYLVAARPLKLGDQLWGALVVAKPTSQLRSRSVTLAQRLGIALAGCGRGRRWPLRRRAAAAARLGRDLASVGALLRHGGEARGVRAAVAQL